MNYEVWLNIVFPCSVIVSPPDILCAPAYGVWESKLTPVQSYCRVMLLTENKEPRTIDIKPFLGTQWKRKQGWSDAG